MSKKLMEIPKNFAYGELICPKARENPQKFRLRGAAKFYSQKIFACVALKKVEIHKSVEKVCHLLGF